MFFFGTPENTGNFTISATGGEERSNRKQDTRVCASFRQRPGSRVLLERVIVSRRGLGAGGSSPFQRLLKFPDRETTRSVFVTLSLRLNSQMADPQQVGPKVIVGVLLFSRPPECV